MDQQSRWTLEAVRRLTQMAREQVPVATISMAIKRPIDEVRAKLDELGITPAQD